MDKMNYFSTPIWAQEKLEFVKSLNKVSNKYRKKTRTIKHDNDFLDFKNYIGQKSFEFLDSHGYDMNQYIPTFSEMWVQEFNKNNESYQSSHVNANQHVSGFYFLKCSDKTPYLIFHEPRAGARATKLTMKSSLSGVENGTDVIHIKPVSGTLIMFPGYLEHQFSVDYGIKPFRFIQWNIQAIPKDMSNTL